MKPKRRRKGSAEENKTEFEDSESETEKFTLSCNSEGFNQTEKFYSTQKIQAKANHMMS